MSLDWRKYLRLPTAAQRDAAALLDQRISEISTPDGLRDQMDLLFAPERFAFRKAMEIIERYQLERDVARWENEGGAVAG